MTSPANLPGDFYAFSFSAGCFDGDGSHRVALKLHREPGFDVDRCESQHDELRWGGPHGTTNSSWLLHAPESARDHERHHYPGHLGKFCSAVCDGHEYRVHHHRGQYLQQYPGECEHAGLQRADHRKHDGECNAIVLREATPGVEAAQTGNLLASYLRCALKRRASWYSERPFLAAAAAFPSTPSSTRISGI